MTTFDADLIVTSHSTEQTLALGRALGAAAEPGLVLALVGPLGAGKTQLVRGIAEGLGVADSRLVSSPSFVLIQQYSGRLPIYHFDTYRLTQPDQFASLGPEEYFEAGGVSIVEWADRVAGLLPEDRLGVRIDVHSPTERRLALHGAGPISARVLERLRDALGRQGNPSCA